MYLSGRDLYPNMTTVLSTSDETAPELPEQLVLVKSDKSEATAVVTKADSGHLIWAFAAVVAVLFAFGLVR